MSKDIDQFPDEKECLENDVKHQFNALGFCICQKTKLDTFQANSNPELIDKMTEIRNKIQCRYIGLNIETAPNGYFYYLNCEYTKK